MTDFHLSITQADKNDTALIPGATWTPTAMSADRARSPFEIMNCGDRDGITARSYLLMVRSFNGELAARFRRNMEAR